MEKEYCYTINDVPTNTLVGTIEYNSEVDLLWIHLDGQAMSIDNYIGNNQYIKTVLPNKILNKIITASIQDDIVNKRYELIREESNFLGMDIEYDCLKIRLGPKTKIKAEYKYLTVERHNGLHYSNGIVITKNYYATIFSILKDRNYKNNLLKFIRVYPEYKDNICKFIDLDNIPKYKVSQNKLFKFLSKLFKE